MKRQQPEFHFQSAVNELLGSVLDDRTFYSAIGHGGGGVVRGAKLKAMGLKPGVPDILIIHGNVPFFGECKALNGNLSFNQKALIEQLRNAGMEKDQIRVWKTQEDVLDSLDTWQIPYRRLRYV